MALFQHRTSAGFRIMDPITGEYARFTNGRLELDEDSPLYPAVVAEAQRNPELIMLISQTTCPECGEHFEGSAAKMNLGKHRKKNHPNETDTEFEAEQAAERQVLVKARAPFACDVCVPLQQFPDQDQLDLHARIVHGSPFVTADGRGVPEDVREQLGGATVPGQRD